MNVEWKTRRTLPRRWKAMFALVTVFVLIGVFVYLEQQRSLRLLKDSVTVWVTENDRLVFVKFRSPYVTSQHWSYVSDSQWLHTLHLSNTVKVDGGLSRLSHYSHLRTLYLERCPWVTDQEIAHLSTLDQLGHLNLNGTSITDEALNLINTSNLTKISLEESPGITDASIDILIAMPALKEIGLNGTSVTYDGFRRLRYARKDLLISYHKEQPDFLTKVDGRIWLTKDSQLEQISQYYQLPHDWESGRWEPQIETTSLALAGPAVCDTLPALFSEFPSLKHLSISDTMLEKDCFPANAPITSLTLDGLNPESDLSAIDNLTSLQDMTLNEMTVLEGLFSRCCRLRQLKTLHLTRCQFSTDVLIAIGQIPSLELIWLRSVPITTKVCERWLQHPHLKLLGLLYTGISQETIDRLRQQYPGPTIHFEPNAPPLMKVHP